MKYSTAFFCEDFQLKILGNRIPCVVIVALIYY